MVKFQIFEIELSVFTREDFLFDVSISDFKLD